MGKNYIFIAAVLVIMLVPCISMASSESSSVTESGEVSEAPSLYNEDGTLNLAYISEAGDYFSTQFGLRREFVTANSYFEDTVFHTSANDQVIDGKDGWLFYTETLDDYTSENLLSERGLNNIVHNIKLIQDYAEAHGSIFLFTIAPNKNSLYGQYMPYYYLPGDEDNNYKRLEPKLQEAGIHYVNLFTLFQEQNEELYLKTDSHWNNKGAALVFSELMDETGLSYSNYKNMEYEYRQDTEGDLSSMLFPDGVRQEENIYYLHDTKFSYVNDVTDNMDDWIETTGGENDAILLMYRDSFGESLLPFFADEFSEAYFSRLLPYNLTNVITYKPDVVILERAERRIPGFAESAAVMQMGINPAYLDDAKDIFETEFNLSNGLPLEIKNDQATLNVTENGDYYIFSGRVSEDIIGDDENIYLSLITSEGTSAVYDAFRISFDDGGQRNDNGYSLYLLKDSIDPAVNHVKLSVNC